MNIVNEIMMMTTVETATIGTPTKYAKNNKMINRSDSHSQSL